MKRNVFLILLLLCTVLSASAQQMTQTIRGIVIDKDSKSPLAFVNVVLDKSNPTIGAISDTNGVFILYKIPVGRQSLNVSFVGYKPQTLSDIQINVAKEIVLTVELEENTTNLATITVTAGNPKDRTVNDMVGISGRTFSTVEANRFAGSQNDPSRMARNYAGVSGANDQRNDIIIRGNAPQGLLWRIEGIPVPNPNHFSGQGSTGGLISIINYKMLSNSDFLTGAFPATYSNDEAFSLQNKTYVKPDVKITIRKDFKRKIALEWALDIQNVANVQNVYFNWYDKNTQREHTVYQNGRFPTVQLKLEF